MWNLMEGRSRHRDRDDRCHERGRRRTGACCGPAAPPVSEQIGGWEAPAPFVCGHRVEVHLKDGRSRKRGSAQPAVFQMSVALVAFLRPELFQAMNKRGK